MANEFVARRGIIVPTGGANITGSLNVTGSTTFTGGVVSGSFTGSFTGDGSGLTGVASTLSVTGSTGTSTVNLQTQALTITGGTGISTSASGQTVTISTTAGTVSSSAQVIAAMPGAVSSSGQIDYNSIANKLSGTISASAQFNALSGTSASYATTASFATTATTASFATTTTTATSASFATTASAATSITFIPATASFASNVNLNTITGTTFSNAAFYFPQDVRVEGTLVAQQIQTEYITSSIIYESGSTKFGDTSDDVMSVTGSLRVLGTISGSMVGMFSSSAQVDYNSIQNQISGAVSSSASGDAQGQIKLNGVNVNITTLQSTSAPSFAAVTAATGFYSGSSVAGIVGPVANQVVSTVPCAAGTAVFFDYAINDTTNYRTGTVMVVSNCTVVEYTDTSTNDIGNTAQAIFAVDILSSLIRLKFTNTSGTWTVKTAIRAL